MRFLFIIKSFAIVGGVERVMADKMNYLTSKGHSVLLVTYEQGTHQQVFELNTSIKHKDINCRFFTLMSLPFFERLIKSYIMKRTFSVRIREIINNFIPDIIISPTYPLEVVGGISSNKGSARLIYESHMAYIQLLKEFSKPRSCTGKIIAKLYDWRAIQKLRKCDCMVLLTKGDSIFWKKYIHNIEVIPNPLSSYPEKIDDVEKDPYRIISVGRLTTIKRFDRLIEAFSRIHKENPKWHIDIFGEGSDENLLNKMIVKEGLENRIIIHPPTKDIFNEMKRSQFLVMSSESEGFALVLIEAMACGVPCVSFDCPYGPGDIIVNKRNGLLAKNGDIQDLANKMQYMMNNPNVVIEMSKYARISSKQYKKEIIMKRWESFYMGLDND